ncbi:MAG: MotA/TolQ/ExbB proton channel family protein [Rhodospirillaceae bacterium]
MPVVTTIKPSSRPEAAASVRRRFAPDPATLFGLAGAFGVVAVAVAGGATPRAYLDLPAFLLVIGGTLTVTAVSFSLSDLGVLAACLPETVLGTRYNARAVARQLLLLAEAARRTGPETLRELLPQLRAEPYLHRCVGLVAEGQPPDEIERVFGGESEISVAARVRSAAILRRAAEVAPSMGLIGTLIGLVQMLGSLNNPAAIGPGMAVALLATFYGAVLGNMILTPLAGKIECLAEQDALIRSLYLTGAVSIARQENPRRLEMLLNAVLPAGSRIRYFDR